MVYKVSRVNYSEQLCTRELVSSVWFNLKLHGSSSVLTKWNKADTWWIGCRIFSGFIITQIRRNYHCQSTVQTKMPPEWAEGLIKSAQNIRQISFWPKANYLRFTSQRESVCPNWPFFVNLMVTQKSKSDIESTREATSNRMSHFTLLSAILVSVNSGVLLGKEIDNRQLESGWEGKHANLIFT